MIGLIASGVFYLKVDDGNRSAFEGTAITPKESRLFLAVRDGILNAMTLD